MMRRIFGAPGRYYQGEGIFDSLGEIVTGVGRRGGVVVDLAVAAMLGERLHAAFVGRAEPILLPFAGEVTRQTIAESARSLAGCDVVAGIGGGKAIDLAKGVAMLLGVPIVTVPTIASNDAPTSSAVAIYDDDHRMIAVDVMPASPAAVVVDTGIIARAPIRFLRAGIGDAIAKKFEADACRQGTGRTMFGTRPLAIGGIVADGCHAQIRRHGAAGLGDAAAGRVSKDFEALVEAVILLSGVGFENGGLSLAHALTRGLMCARGAVGAMHGEQVAYGLRVQLSLWPDGQQSADELDPFYREIGLPRSLADLGFCDATDADIAAIAEAAMTAPHIVNFPVPLDAATIATAIRRLETQERRP